MRLSDTSVGSSWWRRRLAEAGARTKKPDEPVGGFLICADGRVELISLMCLNCALV